MRSQTRILLALRHETFFSLEAMNAAVRRELDPFNEAPMACGESRRAIFEANERDRTGAHERRGVNGRRGRFVHMRQDIAMPASVRVCAWRRRFSHIPYLGRASISCLYTET